MKIITGFGYIKDSEDHIVSKYELSKGDHPLTLGYSYVEVANKAALNAIQIYVKPKTADEIREGKIAVEIYALARAQAIQSLEDKGEL